ncbi:MAG: hypothetical protein JOY60_13105 [Burkholderiaceae bacterium]|nr:hypothetical protein [Roseateles sp.]MBV8470784.1 hypothetical protein [Burkholderiaceae bacterium]
MNRLRRRLNVLAAALPSGWLLGRAHAAPGSFDLVTAADMQLDAAHSGESPPDMQPGHAPRTRSLGDASAPAPVIRVSKPTLMQGHAVLSSPVSIDLRFEAGEGARIVPGSFRVLYGGWHIDITDRILANVGAPTEQGIAIQNANIPAGHHKLTLQISDDHSREARLAIELDIVERPSG